MPTQTASTSQQQPAPRARSPLRKVQANQVSNAATKASEAMFQTCSADYRPPVQTLTRCACLGSFVALFKFGKSPTARPRK